MAANPSGQAPREVLAGRPAPAGGVPPKAAGQAPPRRAGDTPGTVLNVNTLEARGIAAATTGEGIGLTSLLSSAALIALFGAGFVATAGRHLPQGYVTIAGVALALVVCVAVLALLVGAHPAVAERAVRRAARLARRFRPGIDPEKAAKASGQLVTRARSALTGRAFLASFALAAGDLLFDLLSLDLMFLALGYQPGFGPLAVAYAAANIASAIPLTPGGLGVIEATLVAITVGSRYFPAHSPTSTCGCARTPAESQFLRHRPLNESLADTYMSIAGRCWTTLAVPASAGIDRHLRLSEMPWCAELNGRECLSCSSQRPPH